MLQKKCKGLSVKTSSGAVHALAGMKGFTKVTEVLLMIFLLWSQGMMGVALDPNFKKTEGFMLHLHQINTTVVNLKLTSKNVMETSS